MREKKDTFVNGLKGIRNILFGKSEKDPLEKIGDTIDGLSDKLLDKDKINYSELIRGALTQAFADDQKDILGTFDSALLIDAENKDRLRRYLNSEEICDSITYVDTAVRLISDEINSPDDVTKESIQISDTRSGDIDSEDITFVREINKVLKIDDMHPEITYNTLKFGDQFIEVCDFTSTDAPVSQVLLTEDGMEKTLKELKELSKKVKVTFEEVIQTKNNKTIMETKSLNLSIELVTNHKGGILAEIGDDEKPSDRKKYQVLRKNKQKSDLSNIRLIVHDPAYIIKLQSRRFKMCLGYLAFPKLGDGTGALTSNSSYSGGLTMNNSPFGNALGSQMNFSGIDSLYVQLMQVVEKFINQKDVGANKKEVYQILQKVIKEVDSIKDGKIQIRYVPPEHMEHFVLNNMRFFPYGEGLLYKIFFPAKLLMLQEVAVSLKRMSDSVERRVFYVETGLPRKTRNLIDEFKRSLRKRKISLDSFGSIGTIPSMLTAYEDLIIPQIKGKRFVEFEEMSPTINPRDATEELRFFRDALVAGLGVPPSFIGLEENIRTKANLSQESNIFARRIVSYQKLFSKHLTNLFRKIYLFCKKEQMPEISIALPPPKFLQAEMQAEYIRTAKEIIDTLNELGVSKEWAKRKYLNLDWAEIEDFERKEELDKKITPPPEGGEFEAGEII